MTANQIILLLQIYRGTDSQEFRIGTYEDDLSKLIRLGYIEVHRDRYFTTARATAHIRHHILQEMP